MKTAVTLGPYWVTDVAPELLASMWRQDGIVIRGRQISMPAGEVSYPAVPVLCQEVRDKLRRPISDQSLAPPVISCVLTRQSSGADRRQTYVLHRKPPASHSEARR